MKNYQRSVLSIVIIISIHIGVYAQPQLMGTLPVAGNTLSGVIFKVNTDGSGFEKLHDFFRHTGKNPKGDLLKADNGRYYGLAAGGYGGSLNTVLFEFDPVTGGYAIKHDFYDHIAMNYVIAFEGSLIQAVNGKLYGVTQDGGISDAGTIFEFDIQSGACITKFDFEVTGSGKTPSGKLCEAANGKLYGITVEGGMYDQGVLYEFNPANGSFIKLVDFDQVTTGKNPISGVIQASNGKLYGTTISGGGPYDAGVLFEYDLLTHNIARKVDFDQVNGTRPYSRLLESSSGKLYGMTYMGSGCHGLIFEYDYNTNSISTVHYFSGYDGSAPMGCLLEGTDGCLYGMTSEGGIADDGVLFKYEMNGTYTVLCEFYGDYYGKNPYGSLIQEDNGKLFGMTHIGGQTDNGVLFEYDPVGNIYTNRFDFGDSPDGAIPTECLFQAADGMIYGLVRAGGTNSSGSIFRFNPLSSTYARIFDFEYFTTGNNPGWGLMEASDGLLYGVMKNGGTNQNGTLFSFNGTGGTFTNLHNFDGVNYGAQPVGIPLQTSNGKIFGLTEKGGANNQGVLFAFNPSAGTMVKMIDFENLLTGRNPSGSLIEAANGKLYGMTSHGGSYGKGTLFEYDPVTFSFQVMIHFDGINRGATPYGSLVEVSDNILYGLTYQGGVNDKGILFVFDAGNGSFLKLINFDGNTYGSLPVGSLLYASNGKLYGSTYSGGNYDCGLIFEFDPQINMFSKVYEFDAFQDRLKCYHLIEVTNVGEIAEENNNPEMFRIFPQPARDKIIIEFKGIEGYVRLLLISAEGKLVLEEDFTAEDTRKHLKTCFLQDIKPGLYTVEIYNAGKSFSGKIIVL